MIVVVGGIKGGSGKTTIATNLAVMRSATGKKVLLVDADEQNSAAEWAEQREGLGFEPCCTAVKMAGHSLNSQISKKKAEYDDIIIDVGGRDTTSQRSALSIADFFLLPFRPRGYDIWTCRKAEFLISEALLVNPKLKSFAFINQADTSGNKKDNKDAMDILREVTVWECFDLCISNRKSFNNTGVVGLGVVEGRPKDKKAVDEMLTLYEKIYNTNGIVI